MREVADLSEILSSNEISELEQNKKRIVRLEKDFNIFDLFRTIFDENAWTKYFAFLLDSTEKHGLGLKVFTYWSNKIADDKSIFKKFLTTIKDDIISVHSKTEWSTSEGRRVDLLLELFNASNKLIAIIGLENKVDSGEQENQVSDYQKSITFIYPSVPKIILFCTPQGKKSTTAQKYYKECPYLSVDYSYFQKVCQKFSGITIGEINILFNSMDRYLEIMLKKRRNLAILSKTYSKAEPFQKRNRYSPAVPFLNDFIKYALKDDNKSRIPFKFEYKTFSTNEIDFFDRSLGKQNYLIPCYMLNSKKNPQIGDYFVVRLMIWSEILYKRNKNNKKARKQTYDDIFHKMQIPHTNGKPKDWHPWVNVWTSGSYKLTDFGKEDFENLFELLIDSIDKTYSQMKKKYLVYLYQYKELFVNFS